MSASKFGEPEFRVAWPAFRFSSLVLLSSSYQSLIDIQNSVMAIVQPLWPLHPLPEMLLPLVDDPTAHDQIQAEASHLRFNHLLVT